MSSALDDMPTWLKLWETILTTSPVENLQTVEHYEIRKVNEIIQKSIDLDRSGMTTRFLLDHFFQEFLTENHISLYDLLFAGDEKISAYLSKSRLLHLLLQDTQEEATAFLDQFKTVLRAYDIPTEPENEKSEYQLEDPWYFGTLLYNTHNARNTLSRLHIQGGEPAYENMKYETRLSGFWNINSLIRSVQMVSHSFVSLSLVKDPFEFTSFFVFTVKRGDCIDLFTDRPTFSHPLQKYMSRHPGRGLEERLNAFWFPYELLDIDFSSSDARDFRIKNSTLPILHGHAFPILEIHQLNRHSAYWTALMFEALSQPEYWETVSDTPPVITGETLVQEDTIKRLPVGNAPEMAPMTVTFTTPLAYSDVSFSVLKEEWSRPPTGHHLWLEKRFAPRAPAWIFNLAKFGEDRILLGGGDEDDCPNEVRGNPGTVSEKMKIHRENRGAPYLKIDGVSVVPLEFTEIGTPKQIEHYHKWIARYNLAQWVSHQAQEEFDRTHKDVYQWYKERITSRKETLLEAIVLQEFLAPNQKMTDFCDFITLPEPQNILRVEDIKDAWAGFWRPSIMVFFQGNARSRGNMKCFYTGKRCSYVGKFSPTTSQALALLCGCHVPELPEVLQDWGREGRYCGNSILDRIDPMEWAVENPWRKGKFDVWIFVGKTAINRKRKELGL